VQLHDLAVTLVVDPLVYKISKFAVEIILHLRFFRLITPFALPFLCLRILVVRVTLNV
jgi:hypothetical protein